MTILEELSSLSKTKAAEHIRNLRTVTIAGEKLLPITEESLTVIIYEAMIEGGEVVSRKVKE